MRRKRYNQRRHKNYIWYNTFGSVKRVPCHWCFEMLTFDEATVDHEPALSEGGQLRCAVIACRKCNAVRGMVVNRRKMNQLLLGE